MSTDTPRTDAAQDSAQADGFVEPKFARTLERELAAERALREAAEANYRFMVERAANEKLDGYRELGAKCAALEAERDALRAQCAQIARRGAESAAEDVIAATARQDYVACRIHQERRKIAEQIAARIMGAK